LTAFAALGRLRGVAHKATHVCGNPSGASVGDAVVVLPVHHRDDDPVAVMNRELGDRNTVAAGRSARLVRDLASYEARLGVDLTGEGVMAVPKEQIKQISRHRDRPCHGSGIEILWLS